MRLGFNDFSAKEVINKLEANDLQKIFKYFGEEKESKKIGLKSALEKLYEELEETKMIYNSIE